MAQQHKLGTHKTNIITEDGMTKIIYHSTVIVRYREGVILLDSGGWQTSTTKTRMNQASSQFGLGYSVYQKNFEWFVVFKGETIPFKDGMVLMRR